MADPTFWAVVFMFLLAGLACYLALYTIALGVLLASQVLLEPLYDIFKYSLKRFYAAASDAAQQEDSCIIFGLCVVFWIVVYMNSQRIERFLGWVMGAEADTAPSPSSESGEASKKADDMKGTTVENDIKDLQWRVKHLEDISIQKEAQWWPKV